MCKITESLGHMEAANSIGNKLEWNEFKAEVEKLKLMIKSTKKENRTLKAKVKRKDESLTYYKKRFNDEK